MFGTVYKGRKQETNLVVAIKQIDKEMLEKDKLPSIMVRKLYSIHRTIQTAEIFLGS